jgi:hypothetical protein
MLARWEETLDHNIARRTAKVCLILPVQGEEINRIARIADNGARVQPGMYWSVFGQGMASYRASRFSESVERLDLALKARARANLPDRTLDAQAHVFLAMAHHRLNHLEQARKHLEAASGLVQQACREVRQEEFGRLWNDWLLAFVVYAEACEVVDGKDRKEVLAQIRKDLEAAARPK